MKKLLLFLAFTYLIREVNAQSFEWIKNDPVNFNFNPSYPALPINFDKINNRVINARLDSFAYIYSQSTFGIIQIESRDTNGIVQWSLPLANACVQRIAIDQMGNTIVGGQFQQTLTIGNSDSLNYINLPFLNMNAFLIKLDNQGNLLWKKNVSATWTGYESIEALAVSPTGECWYALTDFFTAQLIGMDANGNDIITHTVSNGKTIGNICFDPLGGMYISGGAESGYFIMDADTFHAPYSYNMYLARFNSINQSAWAYFGNDITFQRPMITTDDNGDVFFSGMKFDSLSFNGTFIHQPLPFGDFFAFKADSLCNVKWVVQQPQLLIGPFGSFTSGSNLFVDADADGNLYMGGVHQGFVDWGNGYTSGTGSFSERRSAVVKISATGNTEWVKLGGSSNANYLHALSVSDVGSCYFTGSFNDTANFDNVFIPTTNFYNFMVGKIRNLSTSVPENIYVNNLVIYPNPASEFIMISKNVTGNRVEVIDIAGRILISQIADETNMIDIANLPAGSYIITIDEKGFYGRFAKH
jgi:hypothetical protein